MKHHAPEYPQGAVREAVANALLHRDYSPLARAYPVQMRVFTDRLEVTNPGALYGAITTRELGEEGLNPTRNRRLVELVGPTVAKGSGLGFAAMQRLLADATFPLRRCAPQRHHSPWFCPGIKSVQHQTRKH